MTAPKDQPAYVGVKALADALRVSRETITQYVQRGTLRGVRWLSPRHYTDERPRTARGRWLIELDSVEELLARMYGGEPVPLGILRRLRSLAAKSPQPPSSAGGTRPP